LHFVPGVVVVLGGFAIGGNIELGLRVTEDLLPVEKLLLGGVIERRFGAPSARCSLLCQRRKAKKGGRRQRTEHGSYKSHGCSFPVRKRWREYILVGRATKGADGNHIAAVRAYGSSDISPRMF